MKVGFLLSSFLPRHTGGTEIYVYRLICELQKFNISCFVLNSGAEEFTTTYIYKGIKIIPVPSSVSGKEARFKMLEQIICDEQPDLFHVHELTGPDGFTVLDLEYFKKQNIIKLKLIFLDIVFNFSLSDMLIPLSGVGG
jgi:hypothetical protein